MLYINWDKTMQNLRAALEFNHIKYGDFADKIGVSPQSLSRYLSCNDTPPAQTFMRMIHAVDFQVVYFNSRG